MRVIYTAGCWDLMHRGHLNMLWQSKQMGDLLIVGVISDDGVVAYKGRRPVDNTATRIACVKRLTFVDAVVVQDTTNPTPVLERFRPDVMSHGDDWHELREGHETLERLGIEWRLVPYTPGISTTLLRQVG
jgi:rfaE bifunctional protein nucleotidyltransferase chain/domain